MLSVLTRQGRARNDLFAVWKNSHGLPAPANAGALHINIKFADFHTLITGA